jgi:hypothetical protein
MSKHVFHLDSYFPLRIQYDTGEIVVVDNEKQIILDKKFTVLQTKVKK